MAIDAFGKALVELRDDVVVSSITDRIRHAEPGPDDAKGPGEYLPFVVLDDLGSLPMRRGVPVQVQRIGCRAYAATYSAAKALYLACAAAIHDVGPRTVGTVGYWQSHDDTGGTDGFDPRTKQPYVEGVFEYLATTTPVGA